MKMKINKNYKYKYRDIYLYEIHPFPSRVSKQMATILLHKSIKLEEYMFRPPCRFAYQVQPMCKY
jgi:hypothetical protein